VIDGPTSDGTTDLPLRLDGGSGAALAAAAAPHSQDPQQLPQEHAGSLAQFRARRAPASRGLSGP
jgi:hypothetical protein